MIACYPPTFLFVFSSFRLIVREAMEYGNISYASIKYASYFLSYFFSFCSHFIIFDSIRIFTFGTVNILLHCFLCLRFLSSKFCYNANTSYKSIQYSLIQIDLNTNCIFASNEKQMQHRAGDDLWQNVEHIAFVFHCIRSRLK